MDPRDLNKAIKREHYPVPTVKGVIGEDPTLQLLIQQLMEGMPEHVRQVPNDLKPFWQLRDDLSIEHGCVLFQGRFYIPHAHRLHCLKTLHQGHTGLTKMRLRAQTSMYLIGIGKQIEDHVSYCEPCQICSRSQQKEPAIPLEAPSRPWQKLGMDLFFSG